MRTHRLIALLGILLAGVLVAVTGAPGIAGGSPPHNRGTAAAATLPGGTTAVSVLEGTTTTGIDASLTPAASISGSLMTSTGKPLSGEVDAFLDGKLASSGFAVDGQYQIPALAAESYAVCASWEALPRGTGFAGQCWDGTLYEGTVPNDATLVTLSDGEQRPGIDLTLPPAAAIAGTVTTTSGAGLSNVYVSAHNRSTGGDYTAVTGVNGAYSFRGLGPSATGYRVCFRPNQGGIGYLPRCYRNKPWSGAGFPASVTPVSVTPGKVHAKVDQVLPLAGGIAGKVTDPTTGNGIRSAVVSVYNAKGRILGSTSTRATGHYQIVELPGARGDLVCVHPLSRLLKPSYHGVCWKHAGWNGGPLPTGAGPVSVQPGHLHKGVDLHPRRDKAAPAPATIAGTVTQQSDGTPVENAFVFLYQNGTRISDRTTDASGQYFFPHVRPASGLSICVATLRATAATVPENGWGPRCYGDVPWGGQDVVPPDDAAVFALTAGQNLTGIDVALHAGGAMEGTVTELDGITPVQDATVTLFTQAGDEVFFDFTLSDGTYRFRSLSAGDYVVCFDGRFTGGQSDAPECYDNVVWGGSN